jgi:hypothetical protein
MASKVRNMASAAWSWIGPGGNWKLVLGALTALAILAYVVSLKLNLAAERQGRADDAAQVATERSDALQTASTGRSVANNTRAADRQTIATEQTSKRKQLDDALAANQAWANQPVPPAVADSLR